MMKVKSITFVKVGSGLGPLLAPKWNQVNGSGEEVPFGRMPERLLPVWCERFLGGSAYATRHWDDGRVRIVVQPIPDDFDWTLLDETNPQLALSGCLALVAAIMATVAMIALAV